MEDRFASTQMTAVNRFARKALFSYLSLKETGSLVEEFRRILFSDSVDNAFTVLRPLGLDTEILLSDGYSSLPFVWATIREDQASPVDVTKAWDRLHAHVADDPQAAEALAGLPRELSREQHKAVAALFRGFEKGLTVLLESGEPDLDVYATWIENDQQHAILGMGGYIGEEVSPLLALLRSDENPLPWWEIPSDGGLFLVGVLPRSLARPMNSWLTVRQALIAREFTTLRNIELPDDVFQEIHVVLALMLQHAQTDSYATSRAGLDGAAEYVTHELLSMSEPDEYF